MRSGWRHHLRRARFAAMALVAALLIAAAVFVGLVQLLLPLATHYPDFVANQLSARLHRPVKFAAITSEWQPSGPLLTVRNLTLGAARPGGQAVTLPHAALKFDFGAWLRPAHRWITLRVSDVELRVVHDPAGWRVDGFGSASGQNHVPLETLPVDLDLNDLRVDIVDTMAGRSWRLFAPHLRVVNVGNASQFEGFILQHGTHQAVTVAGRMDIPARDYDIHLATDDLDFVAASSGVDLHGYTIRRGHGDVALWGRWRGGRLAAATLQYSLHDLDVAGPDQRAVSVPELAGVLRARRVRDGWDIAWRGPGKPQTDIDEDGGVIAHVRGHAGAWHVSAAARAVDVAPWLSLLAMAPRAPRALADWLGKAQPRGRIDSAALVWRQGGRFDLDARLSVLGAAAAGKVPGLALGHATLRADNDAMSLEWQAQPATVALTDVFRKPFVFSRLAGSIVAWRDGGHWNIGVPALQFGMGDIAGRAVAHLRWPGHGHRPFLSAYATVTHAKVPDADRFWPYHTMSPELIHWLDHALVSGDVTSGRVLLRGPLDDWPFPDHEGRFEATGTVRNATFRFSDDWPEATGVDAAVDFVNNGMDIVASHASTMGVTVAHARASIPDFEQGVLGLDIRGGGKGGQLLDFVRHSPVGADARDVLDDLRVGGTGKFAIKLSIPLHDPEDFTLDGKVDLAKADVAAPQWKLALKNVGGPLLIHERGFVVRNLDATFRGAPAKLSLAVGSGVADPADIVEGSLDATVSAQALVQGYPELDGLVAHASGTAPFHVGVTVTAGKGSVPATPTLTVRSSLEGIALDFPAPLDKPAAATLPLEVKLRLPPEGAPLQVSLGDVLQVRGRLADAAHNTPTALAIHLGASSPPAVPARGLVVSGHAPRLDVSGWIRQALGAGGGSTFPALREADIRTDDAQVFGSSLGPLALHFSATPDQDAIGVDGRAAEGTVVVPASGLMTRGITADFQHLYWPESAPEESPGPPQPPSASSPVAPAAIPPLHVKVADLRLGNAHLGRTVFESAPTLAGMHVARFDSDGKDFAIRAQGNWIGTAAASQSRFTTDITSHDFGNMLAALGFKGLLAGGNNTHIHIEGTWPGGPAGFSLAWMDGTVTLDVGEGRILAVQPGLGRMLGLLSVRELPSRLALHFGDVFKSGFGFDRATAAFRFSDGNAYTDDMEIKAPAAQITMQGRVGFRARDFDLTVNVVPHLGSTLPVVGAVVGGPVGAAAGLVVQGLLGKNINRAADDTYRVTGGWDKPKITNIATPPALSGSAVPSRSAGIAPVPSAGVFPSPSASVVPAPSASVAPMPPTSVAPSSPASVVSGASVGVPAASTTPAVPVPSGTAASASSDAGAPTAAGTPSTASPAVAPASSGTGAAAPSRVTAPAVPATTRPAHAATAPAPSSSVAGAHD